MPLAAFSSAPEVHIVKIIKQALHSAGFNLCGEEMSSFLKVYYIRYVSKVVKCLQLILIHLRCPPTGAETAMHVSSGLQRSLPAGRAEERCCDCTWHFSSRVKSAGKCTDFVILLMVHLCLCSF